LSKVLPADCQSQTVKVSGNPVSEADILSEGVGASQGVILIDEDGVYYLTSNAADLKETLDKTVDAINKIADVLTTLEFGHGWDAQLLIRAYLKEKDV